MMRRGHVQSSRGIIDLVGTTKQPGQLSRNRRGRKREVGAENSIRVEASIPSLYASRRWAAWNLVVGHLDGTASLFGTARHATLAASASPRNETSVTCRGRSQEDPRSLRRYGMIVVRNERETVAGFPYRNSPHPVPDAHFPGFIRRRFPVFGSGGEGGCGGCPAFSPPRFGCRAPVPALPRPSGV